MSLIPPSSPKGQSQPESELLKVILYQLSILLTTVTEENLQSHLHQIGHILTAYRGNFLVVENFYSKLFNLVTFSSLDQPLTPIERVLQAELSIVAFDLSNLPILFIGLESIAKAGIDFVQFVQKFDCELILSFLLVIEFERKNQEKVKKFIQEHSYKLLATIKTREFPPNYNWSLVLDFILNTPHFPFIHKLLTLSSSKAFKANILPINKFYHTILNMSFKELLLEIGPENLLPEKLLPSLLSIKPNEIDQSIALILAEILIPNSQGLQGALNLSNSLPEANAKGAQLQACFRSIDSNPKFNINWYNVFSHFHELLYESSRRNIQPTMNNITQLLSSLDFNQGIIDIFLNYDWWFSNTLLYYLHNMNPATGAYDVSASKNITLCFEDDDHTSATNLKFVNIAKLELKVLSSLQKKEPINDPANTDFYLQQYFERDIRQYPQYLLAAALTVLERDQFLDNLMNTLFSILMDSDSPAITQVLTKFKELDVQLIFTKLYNYYLSRPTLETVNKILFFASKIDLIEQFIGSLWDIDYKLAVRFLVQSSNYGYQFKTVVEQRGKDSQEKQTFYPTLLDIVDEHAQKDYERGQLAQQQQQPQNDFYQVLQLTDVYYLLEKLKAAKGLLDSEKLKNLQLLLLTTYPRLINFGYGHNEAILKNAKVSNFFPPDVEQEMKSYYSKMYNKEVEIKDIVDMLISMKSSDDPHKQDVFACMIHSLLDEYRFFAEYPLSALASTSLLFGALLEKDLIQGTTLTVALNFIWESCNQPQDSHLFKFAVQSLYNFKSRLHEYPIYCKHLLECQSLSAHAKMYQIVKDAANGIACTAPVVTPTPEAGPKYQSITIVDKTIGFVKQEDPSESVSDKLLFYVNNMTSDNLKLNEIKELLTEKYFAWFSNYLVVDRAKAEPNNHELYSNLVSELDNAIFFEYVLNVSLKEVERIIRNFKDSTTERNQLKNLGAWLGKITLSKDKPLRRDQIALKFLLVEAFDFKSLPLIIPFVCKILDQAQYSKVFKPPNPWVLGIVKVLAELYECANLKLNLKFEIEVLLNSLKIKINDVEQSTLIRSHNPNPAALAAMFGIHPETVTLANDMSKLVLESGEHLDQNAPQLQQTQLRQIPQQIANQPQPQQVVEPTLDTSFSNLMGNSIFTQHANLRRAFQASLSRAVRECAVPILTRVSEAVLTTTEAMMKKDFATERDVQKFRKSYQNLAQQLSHSMVLCSGRKLLSETIEATMLQLLGSTPTEFPLSELNTAIQANVGLCVDIVGKIALDNITELIDERMQRYLTVRELLNPSEPFVEEGASEYALRLPEPLGLNSNGLSTNQLRIYETFGSNAIKNEQPQQAPPQEVQVASQIPISQEEPITFEQLFAIITQNCEKAIQLLEDVKETKLQELPPSHPIMTALTQALTVAQNNALKYPELLLKAAQYAVNCLFTQTHENPMCTEIYVVVLDKLCEYSPSTAKDVTWWLVHSSDQRKFNMPVMYALLKVQLVSPTKLDSSIGRLITESKNPVVIKFACGLLLKIFSSDEPRPIALRSEFAFTLDALNNFVPETGNEEQVAAKEACDKLFEVLEKLSAAASGDLYTQLGYVFSEWIKLLTHGDETNHLQDKFIDGLLTNGILTSPEQFQVFFKAAIEVSVNAFAIEHEVRTRTQHETYLTVDTLAMLIVKIILKFDDKKLAIEYFKNVIGVIIVSFASEHESGLNWNERAYFRFFSSLLSEWADASILDADATKDLDGDFYTFIGEVLNSLQPIVYPGFTFAWVSLIGHRMLLPKLLELPEKKGYKTVVKFLTSLMKFQNVYYKDFNHDILNVLFKAINRIFIGLTHDYPEFLVQCHYQLVTSIPKGYTQLRNIILSATPSNVQVPDPFTSGLKVERLPEINQAPIVNYAPVDDLAKIGLKKPVDNFLRIPAPALMRSIYTGLKLNHPKEVEGIDIVHYNVKLINALVLHVGISAVSERLPNNRVFNVKSSQVALLVDIMNYGSLEFKFHMINAIANQLIYPNSHTHWFVGIILHFFSNDQIWGSAKDQLVIQELITRVLLERRMVSKPHPWGLTIVFTELLKNGDYGFFDLQFVKNASPELTSVFNALSINVKNSTPPVSEQIKAR